LSETYQSTNKAEEFSTNDFFRPCVRGDQIKSRRKKKQQIFADQTSTFIILSVVIIHSSLVSDHSKQKGNQQRSESAKRRERHFNFQVIRAKIWGQKEEIEERRRETMNDLRLKKGPRRVRASQVRRRKQQRMRISHEKK